ncbi:FkbM family methyltransferase [Rhodoligotrophos ferricapiens]|uniref:FkbM family methyltransferase n=1 Tax=Rhodoligotrophos ferricapiens TaxID=3069264 RepID=UPI00315CB68D
MPANLRHTSAATFLLRDWIEPELHYLNMFVRPGDVFIDVGANIGLFTLKAAKVASKVISVEPGSEAGSQLKANVALNGYSNVTIVPKALADKAGSATLHHVPLGDDPQAFSLLSGDTAEAGETVETTTLDLLVKDLGLARVDVVKMDVEGAEELVIAGAQETLTRDHPTVIFEANCPTLLERGGRNDGAWNGLAAQGYRFYRLADGRLESLSTMPKEFGNIIARHPSREV